MLLLTCGAYAFTIFSIDPFIFSFITISLYVTLVGSKTYRGGGTNGPTTAILNLRDYE